MTVPEFWAVHDFATETPRDPNALTQDELEEIAAISRAEEEEARRGV